MKNNNLSMKDKWVDKVYDVAATTEEAAIVEKINTKLSLIGSMIGENKCLF